jgi:hypothetical protein
MDPQQWSQVCKDRGEKKQLLRESGNKLSKETRESRNDQQFKRMLKNERK